MQGYDEDSGIRYILEVDVKYHKELKSCAETCRSFLKETVM